MGIGEQLAVAARLIAVALEQVALDEAAPAVAQLEPREARRMHRELASADGAAPSIAQLHV